MKETSFMETKPVGKMIIASKNVSRVKGKRGVKKKKGLSGKKQGMHRMKTAETPSKGRRMSKTTDDFP